MSRQRIVTGRDPFARQTVRRKRGWSSTGCCWCGSVYKPLWRYYVDADNRSSGDVADGRAFCDIACLRSYVS